MRPDARLPDLSEPAIYDVMVECSCKTNNYGSCGREPSAFRYSDGDDVHGPRPEDKLETQECYVSPQRHHWPVYDSERQCFVAAGAGDVRMSMLDLSAEDARSLQIVDLCIWTVKERGKVSSAPVGNWKICLSFVVPGAWRMWKGP